MDEIEICYKILIENIPQFKEFHEQTKDLSVKQICDKYNINIKKEQD